MTPGRLIDPAKNWQKRKEYVLPTLSRSMCEIMREQESTKKSLGAFKLSRPTKFYWKKVDISAEEEPEHIQLVLFDSQKKSLEKLPYSFHYEYTCDNEPDCTGHNQTILDWEIGQAFRKWRNEYKSEERALTAIREKWLEQMFAEDKDSCLFVGNHHRYQQSFMVLGVFYPKKEEPPAERQLSLFD